MHSFECLFIFIKDKKNNWRIKHEEFIASIRYAKMAGKIQREGGNLALLAPPPPSTNPDYVMHFLKSLSFIIKFML